MITASRSPNPRTPPPRVLTRQHMQPSDAFLLPPYVLSTYVDRRWRSHGKRGTGEIKGSVWLRWRSPGSGKHRAEDGGKRPAEGDRKRAAEGGRDRTAEDRRPAGGGAAGAGAQAAPAGGRQCHGG